MPFRDAPPLLTITFSALSRSFVVAGMHMTATITVRCWFAVLAALVAAPASRAEPVEFNRDVRLILSDICFQCHGPDKAKRKAKLHFDTEEGARPAIVPGKPGESELIRRITAARPAKRRP